MKNKNKLHCCKSGASIIIDDWFTKAIYSCDGCGYGFEIKLKRGVK